MAIRKIIFRAKLDDEWVYGNLIQEDGLNKWIQQGLWQVPIVSRGETVGQFTGLHDKNGKDIYEGDIVTLGENELRCIIDYHEFLGMFYLKWTDDRPQSINDDKSSIGRMQKRYDIEVIGNIYDNPELLK